MDDKEDISIYEDSLEEPQGPETPLYSFGAGQFSRIKSHPLILLALSSLKNRLDNALIRLRHASPANRYTIRFIVLGVLLLFLGGTSWHYSSTATPALREDYYLWETNGTSGNLRERLADFAPYEPGTKMQRNMIQSWKVHLNQTPEYASWEDRKADFNHLFYIDDTQESCIRNLTAHNLHDIEFAYFQLLKKVIVRADFFRYFSIFAFGGIWGDADTWLQKPFREWLQIASSSTNLSPTELESKIGMIVGIEYEHSQTLIQYVFAGKQGHPFLLELIAAIIEKSPEIARGIDKGDFKVGEVLSATGPNHFTRIVQHWIKKEWDPYFDAKSNWTELRSPQLFGDILVLPQYAFGGNNPYHPDHHPDKPASHDDRVFVTHEYRNSWGGDRRLR
jgi:hypothetical protein